MTRTSDKTLSPKAQQALAEARRIIDQSWIEVGVNPEELAREDTIVDVYEMMLAQGKSEKEAEDYLKDIPWEEIQQKHRELFPRLYQHEVVISSL